MIRALLSICLFLFFNTLGFAGLYENGGRKLSTFQNGTLSITVDAAPAPGLSIPKILVLHGFIAAYHNNVNWGDTWNLVIPSGNYKILPLPVTDGTNFYIANSIFVVVPPGLTVNRLITYHIV